MEILDRTNQACDFELLIATRNRENLDFLIPMFPNGVFDHCAILIINQTNGDKTLTSAHKNIRVINSKEQGLSKSRNLALQHAIGKICLIADDDVRYVQNFDKIILEAFLKHKEASLITFKIETLDEKAFKPYPHASRKYLKIKELENISSIEMAFRREAVLSKNIFFDELFGLNSVFLCGEEFVFAKALFDKELAIYYENTVIVRHALITSTSAQGANHLVYARGALKYIKNKNLAYLMCLNMMRYLWQYGHIGIAQVPYKLKIALKGQRDYKKLKDKG